MSYGTFWSRGCSSGEFHFHTSVVAIVQFKKGAGCRLVASSNNCHLVGEFRDLQFILITLINLVPASLKHTAPQGNNYSSGPGPGSRGYN